MAQALVLSIPQEHISKAGKIGTKLELKVQGEAKNTFIYTPNPNDPKLNKTPGTYITVEKNDAGYYGISKVQLETKQEEIKTTDFKTIDPDGIFEEAKPDINTKFDYAEKAFNKAFDIVTNKTEKEERGFESEDIRTMINVVYMSLTK